MIASIQQRETRKITQNAYTTEKTLKPLKKHSKINKSNIETLNNSTTIIKPKIPHIYTDKENKLEKQDNPIDNLIKEQRESGKDTTQTRSHTKEKQIDSGRTDEKEEQEEEKQRMGNQLKAN
jgi:hypothetical protein